MVRAVLKNEPMKAKSAGKCYDLGSERSGEHLRYITKPWFQDDLGVVRPEFQANRVDGEGLQSPTRLTDASASMGGY